MAHFTIGATYGPTDPTRAMLPFIFAASALQDGDSVTLMLFHDAVSMGVKGLADEIVPFGPPQRFNEVVENDNLDLIVCKPCALSRRITPEMLHPQVRVGGMNDFYNAAKRPDAKVVNF
jgi:tRNA 2-thiouridine synthesizing protein D